MPPKDEVIATLIKERDVIREERDLYQKAYENVEKWRKAIEVENDDLKKALGELVGAEEAVEAALLTRETLMDKLEDALERWMSARNLKVTALVAAEKLLEDK